MLDLHLSTSPVGSDALTAGYSCPCGCTPAATFRRGEQVATEGCCCGNEFAVGPDAASHVHARTGYALRTDSLVAPWGERVPVAWAIGPSTHDEPDHGTPAEHHDARSGALAVDPVCGMTVDPAAARAKHLHTSLGGVDYVFCGKGCKLEFTDDPGRYLDPSYAPSM